MIYTSAILIVLCLATSVYKEGAGRSAGSSMHSWLRSNTASTLRLAEAAACKVEGSLQAHPLFETGNHMTEEGMQSCA